MNKPKALRTTPAAPPGVTRAKVAALAAQGIETREIALALGISTQAVGFHLKRLRDAQEQAS